MALSDGDREEIRQLIHQEVSAIVRHPVRQVFDLLYGLIGALEERQGGQRQRETGLWPLWVATAQRGRGSHGRDADEALKKWFETYVFPI